MKQQFFSHKRFLTILVCLGILVLFFGTNRPLVANASSNSIMNSLYDENGNLLTSFGPTIISSPDHYDTPLVNVYTSSASDIKANVSTKTDKSLYFTMPISGRLDLTMEEQNGKSPTIYFYNATTNLVSSTHYLQDGFDRYVIDLAKDTKYRIAFDTSGQIMNIKMAFKVFSIMNNSEGNQGYLPNTMYVFSKDFDNSNLNTTLYHRDNLIRIAIKQKSDINIYKRLLAPSNPEAFIWPLIIYPCEPDYAINDGNAINLSGTANLYSGCTYGFTLEPGIYYLAVGNIGSYFAFQYNLTPYIDATLDNTPPLIAGVTANGVYNKSQTINFTDEASGIYLATLNGVKITNGYQVTKNGTYTLKVTDKVDNSITLHFIIDKSPPGISGVKNKESYKSKRTITFTDTLSGIKRATLNSKPINSGKKVSKLGTYTLLVYDNAGNSKKLTFSIDSLPTISGVKPDAIYRSTRKISFSDKDGIKIATLNGSKIKSTKYIVNSGKYTLKVTDKKKNTITIKFILDKKKPTITGVIHGRTYYAPIKLKFSDSLSGIKKATLNGASIKSGTKITKKAFYTLKIHDKANNTKTITFRLR